MPISTCPNCHKKTAKGKIYCDNDVCRRDRATKRGLEQWEIRKKQIALNKNENIW